MLTFHEFIEAKETIKTFIFWSSSGNPQKAKYQGVVGGGMWDNYIVNAKSGHGMAFFIDAMNVANAKEIMFSGQVQPTKNPNIFAYGNLATEVLKKFGV